MQFTLPPITDLYPVLVKLARILVIIIVVLILTRVIHRFVRTLRVYFVAMMERHAKGTDGELEKRAATLGGIIRKTASVLVWSAGLVMILKEAGFDIGPILAGAGVVGVAVGFGAQNLVRDVIAGLFILLENQIRVNDVAIINGTGGLVEEINLRTTILRGLDGTVHVFPNGTIDRLSNMTREYSYYVFDIGVAYKEDTDHVIGVVKEVADQLMHEEPYRENILAPMEVLGVDKFADSAVIIKTRFKTKPIKQWDVGREMNRRIKKKFDEVGIEIPFPHQSFYFGDASKPVRIEMEPVDRAGLKQIVREVLGELELARNSAPDGSRSS
jgi:moderate conductance mechanosensitive channel